MLVKPMQRMSQRRDVRDEMKTKQAEEKRQQNLSRVRDQLLGNVGDFKKSEAKHFKGYGIYDV